MTAFQFTTLSIKDQLKVLDSVVGKEYWMSMNQVVSDSTRSVYLECARSIKRVIISQAEGCWRIELVVPTESSLNVCDTLMHEVTGGGV